jgi:multidrug efflux pump subunit AcrB
VLALSIALFFGAVFGFRLVTQSVFPPATRPQSLIDVYLPAATHIRESETFADTVERFIRALPGVKHVSSFIGGGALRFLLVYNPERENRAYVEFLVNVDDERKIAGLLVTVQRYLDENHPNANAVAKKFLLGPGLGFACLLTMIVVPVLYCIFFNVKEPSDLGARKLTQSV